MFQTMKTKYINKYQNIDESETSFEEEEEDEKEEKFWIIELWIADADENNENNENYELLPPQIKELFHGIET